MHFFSHKERLAGSFKFCFGSDSFRFSFLGGNALCLIQTCTEGSVEKGSSPILASLFQYGVFLIPLWFLVFFVFKFQNMNGIR